MMMKTVLQQLIREEVAAVLDMLNEEYLDEKGFPRMVRALAGMEPSIDTIGIITAENPRAQKFSRKENRARNRELGAELRKLGYGFYQIKGKYGNVEHPFVVQNITKDDIMRLGSKYEQDSVIYVEKTPEGSAAELIGTADNEYDVRSRVILPLAGNVDDFYSIYKGRKFVIPFFSDVFKDKALVKGRII